MLKTLGLIPRQHNRYLATATNTVDQSEIQQFEAFVAEWWDVFGPVKALHSMNKLRVPFVRDGLISGCVGKEKGKISQPLKGFSILDIGCGGGVLSEPLAKLGGSVTGVDANPNIINLAKAHANQKKLNISYEASTIEEHADKKPATYDAVVASEILEHVSQKTEFIKACVQCLKPSGQLFITTISQTQWANFLGIYVSENILSLLPKGTHSYEKFIVPHQLQRILEDNGCRTELIHGMVYNPFTNNWHWCSDTSINYAIKATKMKDCP